MKISFIRPAMVKGARSSDALHPLAFAVLKGLTPNNVETELYDECIEDIPNVIDTDIAAITAHTFTARRAYEIADNLKRQGTRVIMGGYHPTFMPEETLSHADSVVIGEAEGLWQRVISDVQAGRLSRTYRQKEPSLLKGVYYDREIFSGKKYASYAPLEFSRGCRFSCEFCSISAFHKATYRTRPVDEVISDLDQVRETNIFIVDDNIFGDREKSQEFFKALIPLKKRWGCQISIDIASHKDILTLMARSGCVALLIGFETLNTQNLEHMKKSINIAQRDYEDSIKTIKDHGIMVAGSFVLGYDYDDMQSIDLCTDFAIDNKLLLTNFNTLSPMPGTKLYERYKSENMLLNNSWWLDEKYKYGEVMFKPKNMSSQQLKNGCIQARLRFNNYSIIFKRLIDFKSNSRNFINVILFLIINFIAHKEIKRKMKIIS